jgi:2-polyprenyl-6-methoxyphenol hydroxylase-like FAD-dependent oxidoreductase
MADTETNATETIGARVQACIVGCGPAGAILGLILARQGIKTLVLEKHGDFLRDFRGDTLHASTLEILDELGLADRLLERKHSKVEQFQIPIRNGYATLADFRRISGRFPFIAFMPQWDFLDFITREAKQYDNFELRMNTEVTDLVVDDGMITGIRWQSGKKTGSAHADLTIAADGRNSKIRRQAWLESKLTAPPIDVLWFRVPRIETDPDGVFSRGGNGQFLVFLNRFDYWQVGAAIPKNTLQEIQERGIEAFREALAPVAPDFADRFRNIASWDEVKLLEVRADRLRQWWRPGLLCIGDAAHAMSPVGGIGINYAIQDAVAAANLLTERLRTGRVTTADLAAVQSERELSVKIAQRFQSIAQRGVAIVLKRRPERADPPAIVRLVLRAPGIRTVAVRFLAFGVRPVHVRRELRDVHSA